MAKNSRSLSGSCPNIVRCTRLICSQKGYPTLERAWCFQERLLSKRVVHFTKSEMLWDCKSICHCECGALDNDQNSLMGTYNKVLDSLNFVQETQKYTLSSFQESQELEITLKKKVWEL